MTVHAAEYDGLGRRIQAEADPECTQGGSMKGRVKVTNSGDLDGAFTYLYNGNQIIEVRSGADDVELLVVYAEADPECAQCGSMKRRAKRYIDEIVCQRVKDRGWAYVHQAERAQGGSVKDWNVTALTAMNGAVIERYRYKPYGEFVAAAEYGWFDYDQDGDVDSTDAAVVGMGGACLSSSTQACQAMDADGDRDLDSADYAIINAYVSTLTADTQLQRVPAAPSTRRGNSFAHQGLLYDAEIASYQNRARQYDPQMRRFMQQDPLISAPGSASGFRDGVNIYQRIQANPLTVLDPSGLDGFDPNNLNVCCRDVRIDDDDDWLTKLIGPYLGHCEINEGTCPPEWESSTISADSSCSRTLDNGTACCNATAADIQQCMARNPYSAGDGTPGNNCQSSVINTLGQCCLKSCWRPNWYGGDKRGPCLEWVYSFGACRYICTSYSFDNKRWWENGC